MIIGRSPRAHRLLAPIALLLAACSTDLEPPGSDQICWVDFVMVDGIRYLGIDLSAGRDLVDTDLGEQYATVEFMLFGNVDDRNYQPVDGDAAFLEPDTPLHIVNGYSPGFRLAAKTEDRIYLYEADYNPNATRGADLFDIEGAVDSVEVYASGNPIYRLGVITDSAQVEELVGMVLDAETVEPGPVSGVRYFIAFHLDDGTTTVRPYWPNETRLGGWLELPEAFSDMVYDAITSGRADPERRLVPIGRICEP
ncbi:MAG TPA: hypothetical protein VF212_03090 [Longimicrobiales bacterium]